MKISPVWLSLLGALVRHGLTIVMSPLIVKGILTPEQVDSTILGAVPDIVAWIVVLFALGWSFVQKWLAERKVNTALTLPAGATREDLADATE